MDEDEASSVFMCDTNRVVYVTLRFFLFRVSFATLKLADRQNEKRKDNES